MTELITDYDKNTMDKLTLVNFHDSDNHEYPEEAVTWVERASFQLFQNPKPVIMADGTVCGLYPAQ